QISKMDHIYRGAEVTIISAAGEDEDFGLPGVSNRLRSPQLKARIGDTLFVSTLAHPACVIEASKWSTRGWTYQEAVLSRRRLVFTEEQVYFECNAMNCCESLHVPQIVINEVGSPQYRSSGLFSGSARVNLWDRDEPYRSFIEHATNFSWRTLTYESDALNAFLGVARSY
ncbi:hypothetical protein AOQ84DRAFT_401997, partial [Glonium stellatum]